LQQLLDAVSGHHINPRAGLELFYLQETFDAVLAGHHHIHERDVKVIVRECIDRCLPAMDHCHPMAFERQKLAHRLSIVKIIVDNENSQPMSHHAAFR
jgi:hypothetical protein